MTTLGSVLAKVMEVMAEVPEPQIPLAYLPGLADTAGLLTMSFGSGLGRSVTIARSGRMVV